MTITANLPIVARRNPAEFFILGGIVLGALLFDVLLVAAVIAFVDPMAGDAARTAILIGLVAAGLFGLQALAVAGFSHLLRTRH